ncbi:MAG: cell surface protein, partial [candidate division KSB1 bacterium]|nr:cell surface protein [candidate division KSB1 bacterium]
SRPTLDVQASTVEVLGTVSIPIVLSEAPNGVSGFDLDVTLSDPAVASISDVQFPDFGLAEHELLSGSRARLRAVDSEDMLESGATNAVLATLQVRGLAQGTTEVTVRVLRLDDDSGSPMEVEYKAGSLRVVSPTCPTLPGATSPSRDMDGDARCEDINGNGRLDYDDVLESPAVTGNAARFDFNGNGRADMADVVELFHLLTS